MQEEKGRVELYLDQSTLVPLISAAEAVLIKAQHEKLLAVFTQLLDEDLRKDLMRLYTLLLRIKGGLDPMKEQFETYVREHGLESVKLLHESKDMDAKKYVECLLKT